MKKIISVFIGLLFLSFLIQCKRDSTDSKNATDFSVEKIIDNYNIKKGFENIYYLFPSPAQILSAIKEEGFMYKPELLNSSEKKEMYIKSNEQYLNLGVYIADLSYCALFERNNDAEKYLETIKQMGNKLDLSTKIFEEIITKLNNNLNEPDSILKITNEFFFSVINDLEENNRQIDVIIITTGAYIECLYLSVNNIEKYSEDNIIIQKIAEQMYTFNNLFDYSKKYVSNDDLMKSLSYIEEINTIFKLLNKKEEKLKVKKDGDHHIVISGGEKLSFSDETKFISFKENLNRIRNSITK